MLIKIDGQVISTEMILAISDVEQKFRQGKISGTHNYYSDLNRPFYFTFEIIFYGGTSLIFEKDANYDPADYLTEEQKEYFHFGFGKQIPNNRDYIANYNATCNKVAEKYYDTDSYKAIHQQITSGHRQLIDAWAKAQSEIPVITLP